MPAIFKTNHDSFSSLQADEDKKEVLLDRLGGQAALKGAVYEFYGRMLEDEELAPFFENTDLKALRNHQYKFMEVAFTEIPEDLDVAALIAQKHARLFEKGLNATHFDKVAGHLVETLDHLGVAKPVIDEVVAVVGPLRGVFEEGAKKADKDQVLLDRMGGEAALKGAVTEFYARVLEDEQLAPFFKNAEMEQLKEHQYRFMKIAFTSIPEDMDVVKYLTESHQKFFDKGLNATHFDLVAGHLVATLEHLLVKQDVIDDVVATVGPLRVVFDK